MVGRSGREEWWGVVGRGKKVWRRSRDGQEGREEWLDGERRFGGVVGRERDVR